MWPASDTGRRAPTYRRRSRAQQAAPLRGGPALVPIRGLLVGVCRAQQCAFLKPAADELQADGEPAAGEAAGEGARRDAQEVYRVRVAEEPDRRLEVAALDRRRGDSGRRRDQQIDLV